MNRELLVNSFGGCGSKFLLKQIAADKKLGTSLGELHDHLRCPPIEAEKQAKCQIFLFGDPRDAVMSFFERRKSTHEQHGFKPNPSIDQSDWAYRHCKNIGGDFLRFSPKMDFFNYLENGYDYFRLYPFLSNWTNKRTGTLFIRYERIWDNLDEISETLNLSENFARKFPDPIPRRGDHRLLQKQELSSLNGILVDVVDLVDSLDDVFIR